MLNEQRPIDFYPASDDKELQLRFTEDSQRPRLLVGYAAVFNSLSSDLGGWKEQIKPGAFRNSVKNNLDIRALVDHDPTRLLGRTSNGTLRAYEDERGLKVEIEVPDTSYGRDVMELVRRGDYRSMSFGFRVPAGGQSVSKEGGQAVRTLTEVDLREVSAVSVPAYGATSLHLRIDPEICDQILGRGKKEEELAAAASNSIRMAQYKVLRAS